MRQATVSILLACTLLASPPAGRAQDPSPSGAAEEDRLEALEKRLDRLSFALEAVGKKVDDLLWFERVGDLAVNMAERAALLRFLPRSP